MGHKEILGLRWTVCADMRKTIPSFLQLLSTTRALCVMRWQKILQLYILYNIQKGEHSVKTDHDFSFLLSTDVTFAIKLNCSFCIYTSSRWMSNIACPKTRSRGLRFPELLGLAIWRLQDDLITIRSYPQMEAVEAGSFSAMLTKWDLVFRKWSHEFNLQIRCKLPNCVSY